jgi:hypothetical protein
MSYEEVADKFRECARYSRWPRQKAEAVIAMVRDLESLRNVRELTGLLSRSAEAPAGRKAAAARRPTTTRPRAARGRAAKPAAARRRSR